VYYGSGAASSNTTQASRYPVRLFHQDGGRSIVLTLYAPTRLLPARDCVGHPCTAFEYRDRTGLAFRLHGCPLCVSGPSRLPRYYKRVVKKRLKLLKKKLDALSHRSFLVTFLFTRDYLKYLKLFIIDRFKSSNGNANNLTGYLKYQTIAAFLARISV
jgi:hypothetical protein